MHVGLDDQGQRLDLRLTHLLEQILEVGRLLLGQLDVAELALAEQRNFARLALVSQHDSILAGSRNIGKSQNLNGN